MPRKKANHINYMDMKIPFEFFHIPKAKSEQAKLVERFSAEFGKEYHLNPWIDPCCAVDEDMNPVYVHDSIEEKIARIKVRNMMVSRLKNAIEKNDKEEIDFCNSLREFPILPDSDNGWNIRPAELKQLKERKELNKNE